MPERLGKAVLELSTGGESQYGAGIDRAHTKAKKLDQQFQKVGRTLQNLGKRMTTFVTVPLLGLGLAASKIAGDYEATEIAFTKMLKSGDRAKALLQDITDFSAATPFQFDNLMRGAQSLIAFGTAAEDVVQTLRNLGNAAMGNQETLNRITLAYGKLQAKGKATMEELNLFTEAGVPILAELAKGFDVTTAELFKMITAGKVGFEDVDAALTRLTTGTGKFAGIIEEVARAQKGLLSTLLDNLKLVGREFGLILMPAVKRATEWMTQFVRALKELNPEAKRTILFIAGIVAAIGPALLAFGAVAKAIVALVSLFGILISPWTAVVAAVALGAGLIIANWKRIVEAAKEAWRGITLYWKALGEFIANTSKGILMIVQGWLVEKFDAVRKKIEILLIRLTNAWQRVKDFFAEQFGLGRGGALIPIPDASEFEKRGRDMIDAGKRIMQANDAVIQKMHEAHNIQVKASAVFAAETHLQVGRIEEAITAFVDIFREAGMSIDDATKAANAVVSSLGGLDTAAGKASRALGALTSKLLPETFEVEEMGIPPETGTGKLKTTPRGNAGARILAERDAERFAAAMRIPRTAAEKFGLVLNKLIVAGIGFRAKLVTAAQSLMESIGGMIVPGLRGLAQSFWGLLTNTEAFRNSMESIIASIATILQPVAAQLMSAVQPLVNIFLSLLKVIAGPVQGVFKALGVFIQNTLPFWNALGTAIGKIVGVLVTTLGPVFAWLGAILNALAPLFVIVGGIFEALQRPLQGLLTIGAKLSAAFMWVIEQIAAFGKRLGELLTTPIRQWKDLGPIVTRTFKEAMEAVDETVAAIGAFSPEAVTAEGGPFEAGAVAGAGATFAQQRPIDVTIYVTDNEVYGGDLREFAQLIRDELVDIGALNL